MLFSKQIIFIISDKSESFYIYAHKHMCSSCNNVENTVSMRASVNSYKLQLYIAHNIHNIQLYVHKYVARCAAAAVARWYKFIRAHILF